MCISISEAWMPGTRPGMTRRNEWPESKRRISGRALRLRTHPMESGASIELQPLLPSQRVAHDGLKVVVARRPAELGLGPFV
ncbi:hypothetical protein D4Q52_23915 [Rhodopseudomonas palustris]|uniref:Uncharacterized protein n=1 Tax=Rhodopseudomonas palustris TaxID=1076 RepID=A0A418UXW5_RHOPL|nr:hypothetical protein D4Q52_23915 [Rhodopseudomonas palustris]